jgi:hypothetical protein
MWIENNKLAVIHNASIWFLFQLVPNNCIAIEGKHFCSNCIKCYVWSVWRRTLNIPSSNIGIRTPLRLQTLMTPIFQVPVNRKRISLKGSWSLYVGNVSFDFCRIMRSTRTTKMGFWWFVTSLIRHRPFSLSFDSVNESARPLWESGLAQSL